MAKKRIEKPAAKIDLDGLFKKEAELAAKRQKAGHEFDMKLLDKKLAQRKKRGQGSPMPTYNNEAGRLFDLFTRAFAIDNSEQSWIAWANLFGIERGGGLERCLPKICKRLMALSDTLTTVENDVREQFPEHKSKILLRHFPDLQMLCIPTQLNQTWNETRKRLTPSALDMLEFCASELPTETEIAKEEIDELQRQLNELFSLVRNSGSLTTAFKRWLLDQLYVLQAGIDEFSLRGGRGLKAALARIAGESVLHKEAFATVKAADPGVYKAMQGLVDRSIGVASKINTIYTVVEHAHTLVPMLMDLSTKLPPLLG